MWKQFVLEAGYFHSIGFPSEWGEGGARPSDRGHPHSEISIQLVSPASGEAVSRRRLLGSFLCIFHSIGFPSEWGGKLQPLSRRLQNLIYFHSIGFPSEWGGPLL